MCTSALPEQERSLTHQDHLRCYAARYADLRDQFCKQGRTLDCDFYQLYNHWEVDGQKEGRRFECSHAELCSRANFNILNLANSDDLPFNMCRTLEWQICAARGQLPGQGAPLIRFAVAPKDLDMLDPSRPFGQCSGWHPQQAPSGSSLFGYANDDIFYLEVCVLATICKNSDELFTMEANEMFVCDFTYEGLSELEELIRQPAVFDWQTSILCTEQGPRHATQHDFSPLYDGKGDDDDDAMGALPSSARTSAAALNLDLSHYKVANPPGPPPPATCGDCWRINEGRGSCASVPGCNHDRCDFCTNS